MGLLDDMLGSAVPGGKISKPLMLALLALLASGALFGGGDRKLRLRSLAGHARLRTKAAVCSKA